MPNEMLNEDIQNLFKDLLLQEDIDGERKLLQENGVNVDEESLAEFHKKKEELFALAKENKNELQKIDVSEMEAVSGGDGILSVNDVASAVVGAILALWKGEKPRDAIRGAIEGVLIGIGVNTAIAAIEGMQEASS